jgi:hypothetical protein
MILELYCLKVNNSYIYHLKYGVWFRITDIMSREINTGVDVVDPAFCGVDFIEYGIDDVFQSI